MNFFDRYAAICKDRGLDPCSQRAADLLGTNKATISIWGTKGTTPKGETVAVIASALNVSADYLLGRTDDPTDWTNPMSRAAATRGDNDTSDQLQKSEIENKAALLLKRMDEMDQQKAIAFMEGLLAADKYNASKRRRPR